jgi:hypothetical protein
MSAVPTAVTSDLTVAVGTVAILHGWSIRSTAGATVFIRAGTTDTDPIVAAFTLPANGSSVAWFGEGVQCKGGIRVDASAAIEGAVYHS